MREVKPSNPSSVISEIKGRYQHYHDAQAVLDVACLFDRLNLTEKALKVLAEELSTVYGTCPLDQYDIEIFNDCDKCKDDSAECWRKYAFYKAKKEATT